MKIINLGDIYNYEKTFASTGQIFTDGNQNQHFIEKQNRIADEVSIMLIYLLTGVALILIRHL